MEGSGSGKAGGAEEVQLDGFGGGTARCGRSGGEDVEALRSDGDVLSGVVWWRIWDDGCWLSKRWSFDVMRWRIFRNFVLGRLELRACFFVWEERRSW